MSSGGLGSSEGLTVLTGGIRDGGTSWRADCGERPVRAARRAQAARNATADDGYRSDPTTVTGAGARRGWCISQARASSELRLLGSSGCGDIPPPPATRDSPLVPPPVYRHQLSLASSVPSRSSCPRVCRFVLTWSPVSMTQVGRLMFVRKKQAHRLRCVTSAYRINHMTAMWHHSIIRSLFWG